MLAAGAELTSSLTVSSWTPMHVHPDEFVSARLADGRALRIDAGHQIVPGFNEGRGAFHLEPGGERIDVDPRLGKAGQNLLAVAAVRCEHVADLAVIAERFEGPLRHGVHRERCGKRLRIKYV